MHYALLYKIAPVAELADALDLGSSVNDVGVQVSSGAPKQKSYRKIGFLFCIIHFSLFIDLIVSIVLTLISQTDCDIIMYHILNDLCDFNEYCLRKKVIIYKMMSYSIIEIK